MTIDQMTELIVEHKQLFHYLGNKYCLKDYPAEDLIQDTTIKLLTKGLDYDEGKGSFSNYIGVIMKNLAIDKSRKNYRRFNIQYEIDEDKLDSTTHYTEQYSEHDQKIIERFCRLQLNDNQYKVLILRRAGHKYSEIATYLNIPEGTVKNYLHTSRKKIMDAIEKL